MRQAWGAQKVEAVDYELVWVGHDPSREPLGAFADVHAVEEPVWRLVSGYLMLAADVARSADAVDADGPAGGDEAADADGAEGADEAGSAPLVVSSHGRAVARLRADGVGFVVELGEGRNADSGPGVVVEGSIARTDVGIALVADRGTVLRVGADGRSIAGHPAAALTDRGDAAHRPAEASDNRCNVTARPAEAPHPARPAHPAGPAHLSDASQPVWGVTVVHGPAETKIENRIRLLRSLERVGGRHV